MTLLRETGFLLLAGAVLMALVPALRRRGVLAVAIVAAVLAADAFVHNFRTQYGGMRIQRLQEGTGLQCRGEPCRPLKDLTYAEKVDQTGRSKQVNQSFLNAVAARVGNDDRYYLISAPDQGEAPFWITYFLLPRIAVWAEGPRAGGGQTPRNDERMAQADWVVVYDDEPPAKAPPGADFGESMTFGDGYHLLEVER